MGVQYARNWSDRRGRATRAWVVGLLLAGCSGSQPPPTVGGTAWSTSEGDMGVIDAAPAVKYWDESMIDEAATQQLTSCGDWPLTVTASDGPLRTLSDLWQQHDRLWISPGGPFAQPTRHYFECQRQRFLTLGAWDTGEFVFQCLGGSFTIGVRSTHPPRVADGRAVLDEFRLPPKYANAAPNCDRLLITVMTPDGETFEYPSRYGGERNSTGLPDQDLYAGEPPKCWRASLRYLSRARDEQWNPEGGECIVNAEQ